VESDIANCLEAIPHDRLMAAIEERIVDRHVLKLLRALLRAGVLEDGAVRRSVTGTPQGGVLTAPTQSQTSSSSARFDAWREGVGREV
jgi:retron-type reverse transcriptase